MKEMGQVWKRQIEHVWKDNQCAIGGLDEAKVSIE